MPQNIYEIFWIFILYAFIGWCVEVVFAGVNKAVFVNRGFLNGPYCPIYGFGILAVVAFLYPISDNWIVLFLGSCVLATIIEYLTGFVLERLFNNKWWDYSGLPFNIQGYVCLKYSIIWGLGCTFIIKIVHPMIYQWIAYIPDVLSKIFIVVIMILFAIDTGNTIATIISLNRRIKLLDEIAGKMKKLSDEIGEDIFEKVTLAVQAQKEIKEEQSQKVQQFMELKAEFSVKMKERHSGSERLVRAFPDMRSKQHRDILEKYKKYLREKGLNENDG